ALRRATLVAVTRKAVPREEAEAWLDRLGAHAPGVPRLLLHLRPDALRRWGAPDAEPVSGLAGERVLAVSGIGDPRAFAAQLRAAGAEVDEAAHGDHHAFDAGDAERLAARAAAADRVVCTLKDAVKLGPLWPRGAPALWYVSQRVVVERGARVLADSLDRLLAARDAGARAPG
ncbi:tetraacyldisaccharide 4'-kinase, partial [Roseisolibacter sp. H3M3-2]|uniref:tetraacyldisaccharide 4'-kinase n=1 Tax=Roseisolibacter sp. H3M3-2 TaxID=3031323 RepID=UPI0023DBE06F